MADWKLRQFLNRGLGGFFAGVSGRIRLLATVSGVLLAFVVFQFGNSVVGQLRHFEREAQALRYLSALQAFSFMLLEQKKVPLSGLSAEEKSLFVPWLEDVEREATAHWQTADRALVQMEIDDSVRFGHQNLHARWKHLSDHMLGMSAVDIEWEFLGLRREMDVQARRISEYAAMGGAQSSARFQLWQLLARDLPNGLNAIDAWRTQLNTSLRDWSGKNRAALEISHALLTRNMDELVISAGLVTDAGSQTEGALEAVRNQVNGLDSQLQWILDTGPDAATGGADVIELYAGASRLLDAVRNLIAVNEGNLSQRIYAERDALLRESLITLIAGVLALALLGVWFTRLARGVTRPLNDLRAAARQLAGDRHSLWETVPEQGSGLSELRELASAFNVLAEDVKTREAELAEQNRLMEQQHLTMQEGVLVLDRDGRVVRTNPAACDILQRDEAEVLGRHMEELFDDAPQLAALEQWLKNVHLPGLQALHDEGTKSFWQTFWHSAEPVVLLRNQKWISAANPAAERLLEYEASALVGMPVDTLFPALDAGVRSKIYEGLTVGHVGLVQKHQAVCLGDGRRAHLPVLLCPIWSEESPKLAICLAGGSEKRQTRLSSSVRDIEWRYTRPDGSARHLLLSSSALRDAAGMISGAVVTLKDVSELSALQERETLRLQMDNQSRLATLGEMATGVAHEVNQPLTYISATIQTLERAKKKGLAIDDEKMLGMFKESRRQIDRITRIINHLRVFGRDHSGEVAHAVHWPEVLDDTLILMNEKLHLAGVSLERQIEPDLPGVKGLPSEFEQVLINLLQNAHDALEGNPDPRVSVEMRRVGAAVEVAVADNGLGMPESVREKCFEPFYTTKEVGKGTGIGLSLVHGIVTRHGGTISVSSTPGEGTRFVLRFPAIV